MNLTPQAQAVMLLTVSFGKSDAHGSRPLSNGEWARFAIWLKEHGLEPAALLKADQSTLLQGWMDRSVSVARLQALLARGAALGLALEKWQRAGLWVLTRADPEYPDRLKRRLRSESPAVLFGCGNKSLLAGGGIAVVGSRDASEDDLAFTAQFGKRAAAEGYSIVSGGARGVDQAAMMGALEHEGTAVGVLADSLLRSATSAQYRKRIMSGDLVLITPFNPEAGFNVGHAMARNRYIYCLADVAVVVSSAAGKGGTWSGALEDIEAEWVPLWVKAPATESSGNPELIRRGAHWLPDDLTSLSALLNGAPTSSRPSTLTDLPLLVQEEARPPAPTLDQGTAGVPAPRVEPSDQRAEAEPELERVTSPEAAPTQMDFYSIFLSRMMEAATATALSPDEIAAAFHLEKSQVGAWLKRGVDDGTIRKLSKPTRYQWAGIDRPQASLFGENG
jgi:predicted Rossmann fold nucleotide-binding protein DprA/Smf involved in DNA uptake